MKEEEGLVIEANSKRQLATVRVGRHEECTECGACAGSRQLTVEAVNTLHAKVGQRVRFQMQEQQLLKGAFIVFILPLLTAGLGYYLGWLAGSNTELGGYVPAVCTASLGFMGGVTLMKHYDKRAAEKEKEQPVITEILG